MRPNDRNTTNGSLEPNPLLKPVPTRVFPLPQSGVRLRFRDIDAPIRALASSITAEGAIVDCDLGWLRLGDPVAVELAPGEQRQAVVRSVGINLASAPWGATQLRMMLDFSTDLTRTPLDPTLEDSICPDDDLGTAFFNGATVLSDADDIQYQSDVKSQVSSRRGYLGACLLGLIVGVATVRFIPLQTLVSRVTDLASVVERRVETTIHNW